MKPWLAYLLAYPRQRPVVSACFTLTVLLAFANHWLWQERAVIAQRDDEARHNGEFMLQALNRRTHIEADLAALREALTQIDGNLLEERSMEVNLGYFYRCEKSARVRLVRLNQLASTLPPPDARYKAVPFSMQVAGSYRNAMSFLRALENGPRVLRIRNFSFERTVESGDNLIMDLTVDVLAKL